MLRYFAVLAILAFGLNSTFGQILHGSLTGSVRDASGAAMPGVRTVLKNSATGQNRETSTDESGAYAFSTLLPGIYEVTLSKEGFKTQRESGLNVVINNVKRADAVLQVGAVGESVTVEASAATLQTDRAEVRSEVTSKELLNVPVPPGRNYQGLFVTIPGFSPPRTRTRCRPTLRGRCSSM